MKYNTEEFRTKLALISLKDDYRSLYHLINECYMECIKNDKVEDIAELIFNQMPNTTHQRLFISHFYGDCDFTADNIHSAIIDKIVEMFYKKYPSYEFLGYALFRHSVFPGYYDRDSDKYYQYTQDGKKVCFTELIPESLVLYDNRNTVLSIKSFFLKMVFTKCALVINNDHKHKIIKKIKNLETGWYR